MPTESDYFVDGLLSSHEINLIYGPPGSGKTRLMFDLFQCIIKASKFLGQFNVSCLDFAYATYDRSEKKTRKLLEEFDLSNIMYKSLRNVKSASQTHEDVPIDQLPSLFPSAKVIAVDGFGLTIPGGKCNDYSVMGNYLRWCGTVAEKKGVAFLFSLHTPKQKTNSQITNARQMALGSTILSGIAEGMIYIDHYDSMDLDDSRRIIRLLPHDAKPQTLVYEINEYGKLVPWVDPKELTTKNKLYAKLPNQFDRATAIDVGEEMEIPIRTVDRYIKQWLEDGQLFAEGTTWRTYFKRKVV